MSSDTVLLVEDDERVRRVCALLLGRTGCSVLQAGSAAEAIHLSETHAGPIQLLISDVVLPDVNGHELAKRLAGARPELRVLLLSGYPEQIAAADDQAAGSVEFMAKPFSTFDFLHSVHRLLDRKPAE